MPALVKRCEKLTAARKDIEIILVNNGSKDESEQVLSELLKDKPQIRTVKVEVNQGYGFGIVSGLRVAQGEILGWTHADMQTDPNDILKALEIYEANAVIKGKRKNRILLEAFFNFGMQLIVFFALKVYLDDINSQPKLFSRKFYEECMCGRRC